MAEETELPCGLCCECSNNATASWQFHQLCLRSNSQWRKTALILSNKPQLHPKDRSIYIGDNVLIKDNSQCGNISEAVERLNSLIGHKQNVQKFKKTSHKSDVYECKYCRKEFALPYFLNRHLINTGRRACTFCGKIVAKEVLAAHLLRHHNKNVVSCTLCHKLFEVQTKLDEHMQLYHGKECTQCAICKNGFKNERSLRAHMYTHTLFNCSACNASFENRKCYLHHRKNCDGVKLTTEGRYECHDCGVVYTKKPSLKVHIVQKHLNVLPYVCQVCGKRSSTKTHLKSHELVHKSERKVYECFCGAKMMTELGFNMHQRIHSGEKPYVCEECGDRFLSSSRRLDHIKRRHRSKQTAHGCDRCDARFIRPFELKKHYRSAHMIHIN